MNKDIPIYIISFKNNERKNRMIKRLHTLDLKNITFTPEVYNNDERIIKFNDSKIDSRTWSIMLQHLDAVKDFY